VRAIAKKKRPPVELRNRWRTEQSIEWTIKSLKKEKEGEDMITQALGKAHSEVDPENAEAPSPNNSTLR
jgi:hypothetical protein